LNVVGLGSAGCGIADKFAQYPQYNIYKIDVGLTGLKKDGIYSMPKQKNAEAYESQCPSLKNFFKNISGKVLFILCGAGKISGTALRILESLKGCKINILYVLPDVELLSEIPQLRNKIGYNVLQEYARSGLFERMYIVHNPSVEALIGNVPIVGYYDKLNNVIAYTMHMINVFKNTTPIMNTFSQPVDFARISTFGAFDKTQKKENLFFSLDNIRERVYYYGVPDETLKSDGNLLKTITEQVKSSSNRGKIKTSFGIFSTEYEENYCFTEVHTSFIQNIKKST
jgi:hypothetical protein